MRPRDWRLRIEDILDCIAKLERYTASMTLAEFSSDDKTIDAVARNIEIIGEAASHIAPQVRNRHPELPWMQMRALRNAVAHAYFGVSLPIVWQTVKGDLPPLVPLLRQMLEKSLPED